MTIALEPIGVVRCTRAQVIDDGWDGESSRIELDPARFGADALLGLDTFSHVEVVFFMNQVDPARANRGARHPRGETRWPAVGIFAQRAKDRPNPIGLTVCRVRAVRGLVLEVEGLDAVDGTPVLDLKPWMAELGPRGEVRQSHELMAGYW